MNNPSDDPSELDFYISANRESLAAQEIEEILREAGYCIYVPARNNEETEADRIAANRSKAIVFILTKDSEQTQIDLEDLLNILSVSDDERRVIIFQFEESELASLLDRNFIINLVGLNSQDRKLRVLASVEVGLRHNSPFSARPSKNESRPKPAFFPAPPPPTFSVDEVRSARERLVASFRQLVERMTGHRDEPKVEEAIRAQRPTPDELAEKGLVEPVTRVDVSVSSSAKATVLPRTKEKDIVEFGVSHPRSVAIGVAFMIDVLIYRQDERGRAVERAAELRPENDRFDSARATEVARGTKLSITLGLPWATEPEIQTVYWNGLIANVSFRVAPTDLPHAPVYGVCKISVDGLTIGQVFFRLEVNQSGNADERKLSWARAIKTAFASYTSKDRRHVLARVQEIEKLGVKVFMDTHGLRSNEEYKKRIFEAIDSSDILYLFWSRHAKRSNWVDQEWRYGFRQKGLGFIDPVPLVDPRKVPPPDELAEQKHFNDWTLIYSEYEKSLSPWARIRSWLADLAP